MKNHLALKQTIKWVIIPVGFCGIGYFGIAPLLDNNYSTKYDPLIQNQSSNEKTSLSLNSTSKKENKELINNLEFIVEDITPEETSTPTQSITPNFPQSNPNPKKPKRKTTSSASNVQVIEEVSEIKIVEEPTEQPLDLEL